MIKRTMYFILLCGLFFWNSVAFAQQTDFERRWSSDVSADKKVYTKVMYPIAFRGNGGQVPITITIENKGPDIVAQIDISVPKLMSYSGSIDVTKNGKVRYQKCIMINSNVYSVTVRVTDQNQKILFDKNITIANIAEANQIVYLGIKPRSIQLKRPEDYRSEWEIFIPEREALPDTWQGYSEVTELVIADYSQERFALEPEQERAIRQWVHRGGRVMFVLGGKTEVISKCNLFDLMPGHVYRAEATHVDDNGVLPWIRSVVRPSITDSAKMEKLVDKKRKETVGIFRLDENLPGPPPIYYEPTKEQKEKEQKEKILLFCNRAYKGGNIRVMTIDFDSELFVLIKPEQMERFLTNMFGPGISNRLDSQDVKQVLATDLTNLNRVLDIFYEVTLPHTKIIVSLLLAYIFLLGPLEGLLTKRYGWGKKGWTFYLITAALFSLISYTWGASYKQTTSKAVEGTIVTYDPDHNVAEAHTLLKFYSTAKDTYSLNLLAPDAHPEQLTDCFNRSTIDSDFGMESDTMINKSVEEKDSSTTYMLATHDWGWRNVSFNWTPKNIDVAAYIKNGQIVIDNKSTIPLYDCSLFNTTQNDFKMFGNVNENSKLEMNLAEAKIKSVNSAEWGRLYSQSSKKQQRRQEFLKKWFENAKQKGARQYIGFWLNDPILFNKQNPSYQIETFCFYVIPVQLQP